MQFIVAIFVFIFNLRKKKSGGVAWWGWASGEGQEIPQYTVSEDFKKTINKNQILEKALIN